MISSCWRCQTSIFSPKPNLAKLWNRDDFNWFELAEESQGVQFVVEFVVNDQKMMKKSTFRILEFLMIFYHLF